MVILNLDSGIQLLFLPLKKVILIVNLSDFNFLMQVIDKNAGKYLVTGRDGTISLIIWPSGLTQ